MRTNRRSPPARPSLPPPPIFALPRPVPTATFAVIPPKTLRVDQATDKMIATFNGDDLWSLVHTSGVGLLSGSVGKMNVKNLAKTLLRLAAAGQESGRTGGPTLTAR